MARSFPSVILSKLAIMAGATKEKILGGYYYYFAPWPWDGAGWRFFAAFRLDQY
jgi:hypothetical protein